jgi:phosphoribosylamine--glycine ligase
VVFSDKSACCVVLASEGYPAQYETGFTLTLPKARDHVECFVAGAKLENGQLLTAGGRVLGVTAVEDTLPQAIATAYRAADDAAFTNKYCRRDIGARALAAVTEGGEV